MGFAIDTNNTFEYVLQDHRTLPTDKQPKLIFRFLSARDIGRMDALIEESAKAPDVATIMAKAIEGISIGLVGWEGFDKPFSLADVDDILTRADIVELRDNLSSAMTISQLEKKASALRALSTTASSVEPTPKVSA